MRFDNTPGDTIELAALEALANPAQDPGADFAQAIADYLASPAHYFYDLFGAYPEGYCPEGFVLLVGVPGDLHAGATDGPA